MGEYRKGKYSFSLAPALSLIGEDVINERALEAGRLIAELEDYGVIIRDLAEMEVPYEVRNEILNIAMFISEDAETYNYLYEKKHLPMAKLARLVMKNKKFLEKWNEYIITYSIILGDYNYKNIASYFKIIENTKKKEVKQEEKVIEFITTSNEKKDEDTDKSKDERESQIEHRKGILILKVKKNGIVITSSGEFIKSAISCEDIVGEEVVINAKKKIKNLKFYISILAILILCAISIGVYKYTHGVSTIVFEAGEPITLEINTFNRVVRTKSATDNGTNILNEVKIQDRDIDTAMYRLVKYFNEEEILKTRQILITVSGNAIKHGVLAETTEYLSKEGIVVRFNNAGYESSLY